MRYLASVSIGCAIALGSALTLAQPATAPGFHVVELPKVSGGAKQLQSNKLLETAHVKLVSIVIPKGGVLPVHAAAGQVSIHALSGSGDLQMGGDSQRLDPSRLVVLAPGMRHEVRASADADLVLLVHEVGPGPRGSARGASRGEGIGPGMGPGPGAGPGMGMGPGMRAGPRGASPAPEAGPSKK